jgi:hypothetical protein
VRIFEDTIGSLVRQGYRTLQVPVMALTFAPADEPLTEEHPDEYFIHTNPLGDYRSRLAVGREQGFLFLSRRGFEHFRETLRECFEEGRGRMQERGHDIETFEQFEQWADEWFHDLLQNTINHFDHQCALANRKYEEARSLLLTRVWRQGPEQEAPMSDPE